MTVTPSPVFQRLVSAGAAGVRSSPWSGTALIVFQTADGTISTPPVFFNSSIALT